MEARLKAILEMESSQMQKELVAASNNLKKFERELAKATDTNHIQYLQRSIGILKADIDRMTQSANGASKAMGAVGGAMKSSQMNTQNFARVIQDLPFGFMGIQNNLTQLVPGIGAAGLAFSALTAAITFSQVGLQYWMKDGKKTAETLDSLEKYTKSYTEEVGKERAQLAALFTVATNANVPLTQRKNTVKEIRDLYGNYLKDFTDEQILAGKAATAYNQLADAIMRKAKANAAQEQVGQLVAKQLEAEIKMAEISANAQAMAAKAQPQNISAGPGMPVVRTTKEDAQRGIFAEAGREVKKLADEYVNLQDQINKYISIINNNQVEQFTVDKPERAKSATERVQKDSAFMADVAMNADWQQKKGKNWWRNTQTERGNNLGLQDTTKVRIEENRTLNKILIEQAEVQAMLNQQLEGAAQLAEYGGQVFGQMVQAMMNGQSVGDVLANAFKQITVQIAAAVAQALIFASLLEAFPALKGVFGTVGAISGNMGQSGGIGNLIGQIQGQNIQLSMNRTSTGMGFRRGRR